MSPRRRAAKHIPHRPHFFVEIRGDDAKEAMYALASSFKKGGFEADIESLGFGIFRCQEGLVTVRFYEHFRKRPKATVWCYLSDGDATRLEIEAFADVVEKIIQDVPDIKVQRDNGLLYEKRYADMEFPDEVLPFIEPPVLWFEDYFKDSVISYIWRKVQVGLKNHRRFFETFLARPLEERPIDKSLDILRHYHYSAIFWLAASRMSLNQLIELIGITGRKRAHMKGGSFKFRLQVALGSFLMNLSSALDALAQVVNLTCLWEPKEEDRVSFKEILEWIENSSEIHWKIDISQLKNIFLTSNRNYTSLVKKCLEMKGYRNVIVHRRLPPLVNTVRGAYVVRGDAGRLVGVGMDSRSSRSRLIAVHLPYLEAEVDKATATIAIDVDGGLFLPRLAKGKLVYDYPIDRSQFNRKDVLLQFEKYYECVSSLIEKVYAALLHMPLSLDQSA